MLRGGRFVRSCFTIPGLALMVMATTLLANPSVAEERHPTVAFYNPISAKWRMDGVGDFFYGIGGDTPMLCDWDGDGTDTVGQYRQRSGFLYLRNSNTLGYADVDIFYGMREDLPVCGDWNGDGIDTIGIFRPSEARFYLRNSNTLGFADFDFPFGWANGVPIAGDWNGDGTDSVGLWRPGDGAYLISAGNTSGIAHSGNQGGPTSSPVVGDWDGDRRDTVATFDHATGILSIGSLGDQTAHVRLTPTSWTPLAGTVGGAFEDPIPGTPPSDLPPPPPPGPAEPPAAAISIWPGDDIQSVVDGHPEGAAFFIRTGVHRMQQVQPKSGQTFVGESGAVLRGSRALTGWVQEGGLWFVPGQTQQGLRHGSCETGAERCKYPEDLYVDGVRYEHVSSPGALGPGKWLLDYSADRIYVSFDPRGKGVEASVTQQAFIGSADDVTVRGLVVEFYANPAQHGAIDTRKHNGDPGGRRWIIEDNVVRDNHGVGIKATNHARVLRNTVVRNGQLGISAVGAGVLFANNEIGWNGTIRYEHDWERGGSKFAGTLDLVVRNNYVHHNTGRGLWADLNAYNSLFDGNRIEHNTLAGIYHEISYSGTISHNYLEGNGKTKTVWLWGAGIVVANSPDVEVFGNILVDNGDGIGGVHQDRSRDDGDYGPLVLENFYVHDNHITMMSGQSGVAQDVGDSSVFTTRDNRFSNNTFVTGSGNHFEWANRQMDYDSFLSHGQS